MKCQKPGLTALKHTNGTTEIQVLASTLDAMLIAKHNIIRQLTLVDQKTSARKSSFKVPNFQVFSICVIRSCKGANSLGCMRLYACARHINCRVRTSCLCFIQEPCLDTCLTLQISLTRHFPEDISKNIYRTCSGCFLRHSASHISMHIRWSRAAPL